MCDGLTDAFHRTQWERLKQTETVYEVGAATHMHTTGTGTRHLGRPSHPMDRPRGYSLVLQCAGLAIQRPELSFI